MSPIRAPFSRRLPATRQRLALALAAALVAAAALTPAQAANLAVANCNDSGSGSLRATVAAAGSGDTVDLSTLACSSISLSSGVIDVGSIADLTISAAPGQQFALVGNGQDRLFQHAGTGWLQLNHLVMSAGRSADRGGCLFSLGSIRVQGGGVSSCSAGSDAIEDARGGAIAAQGQVSLIDTQVSDSRADGHGRVLGGAVYGGGEVRLTSTTIRNNTARSHVFAGSNPTSNIAQGGGAHSDSGLFLTSATISANTAQSDSYEVYGGGISAGLRGNDGTAAQLELHDSIVSGNINRSECEVCAPQGGGVAVIGPALVERSTISDNTVSSPNHYGGGGGLRFFGGGSEVQIVDSVIGGNAADSAGGGMIVPEQGRLTVQRSRIENNRVGNDAGLDEGGGGVLAFGATVLLIDSSVTGNTSGADGAGLNLLFGEYAPDPSLIANSTISGNVAQHEGGGVFSSGAELQVRNSTIAFNTAGRRGAGISADNYTYSIDLKSSIIANNATLGAANNVFAFFDVSGSKNLIPNAAGLPAPMPADTLTTDPLLLPLAMGEGSNAVRVHAFAANSPALGAGGNSENYLFDSRGWPFVRAFGAPDIGAYEDQPNSDRVFADDFDAPMP